MLDHLTVGGQWGCHNENKPKDNLKLHLLNILRNYMYFSCKEVSSVGKSKVKQDKKKTVEKDQLKDKTEIKLQ